MSNVSFHQASECVKLALNGLVGVDGCPIRYTLVFIPVSAEPHGKSFRTSFVTDLFSW